MEQQAKSRSNRTGLVDDQEAECKFKNIIFLVYGKRYRSTSRGNNKSGLFSSYR